MRFDRQPRDEGYQWTRRKESAYLNRHKRIAQRIERDYPLFADEFAPAPETNVDAEKARRIRMARESEQRMRDLDARQWRRARAAYFACDPATRGRIMAEWQSWSGPAKVLYFTYVVEKHNGVGEARSRVMRERDAAREARITAILAAQGNLLGP
ncbi:hypothetical protein ACV229_36625 [Burkholderia sp. MR1-5-21]